jgi:uncharacterized membrane protein (UPF0182 family)
MYRRSICGATRGRLPELKRVIAAYGENLVMKETLAEALSPLFMEPRPAPAAASAKTRTLLGGPALQLIFECRMTRGSIGSLLIFLLRS